MDESKVKELAQLLRAAVRQVVIRRGANEFIDVAAYRANLQKCRESHNSNLQLYMSMFTPEIRNLQLRENVLDIIKSELASYLRDDKIHSATMAVMGGYAVAGAQVERILHNLIRRAIVDGEESAAIAFGECITNTFCVFQDYHLLTGLKVGEEVEVFDGIRLIPLANSKEQLPAYLPPMLGGRFDGPNTDAFLSKTLLCIDYEVSPIFHKPSQEYTFESGPDSHFNITIKSKDVPDFDLPAFYQALSLGCRRSVRTAVRWQAVDFYEIFHVGTGVGGAGGFSWSLQDVHDPSFRDADKAKLEEARSLYFALTGLSPRN